MFFVVFVSLSLICPYPESPFVCVSECIEFEVKRQWISCFFGVSSVQSLVVTVRYGGGIAGNEGHGGTVESGE